MRISIRSILPAILVYNYIPLFLFFLGWVKLYISIPISILLLIFVHRFIKSSEKQSIGREIEIGYPSLFLTLIITLIVAIICGYGGLMNQAFDWYKHNAILQDLRTHQWPVLYPIDNGSAMLVYYHALYLLPALLGKVFQSPIVTEISFGVICYLGLLLMVASLFIITNANTWYKQILLIVFFVLFSGEVYYLHRFCNLLIGDIAYHPHALLFGDNNLQYRSIFVMLRWVGPQCFVAWLSLILFYTNKDEFEHYAIIALPVLLGGTWAFLGLISIMVFYWMGASISDKTNFLKIFSLSNVVLATIPGIILVLYLFGNTRVQSKETGLLTVYHGIEWFYVIVFLFFMYGIYIILIWHYFRKQLLFYSIPLSLWIIPFLSIGGSKVDFVMCTSIPAITLLFIFVCKYLFQPHHAQKQYCISMVMVLLIIMGNPNIYSEVRGVFLSSNDNNHKDYTKQTLEICTNPNMESASTLINWDNYVGNNIESNFFYKYFAKRQTVIQNRFNH